MLTWQASDRYARRQTLLHDLETGEMIIAIMLPSPKRNTRSYYIKQGSRDSHDWPIADVAVVIEMRGKRCKEARIVLGAAAPIPWLSLSAAEILAGQELTAERAEAAAEAAMAEATPLAGNEYKVPIFKALIQRAILKAS